MSLRHYGWTVMVVTAVIAVALCSSPAQATELTVYEWWTSVMGWDEADMDLENYDDEGDTHHNDLDNDEDPGTWVNGDALTHICVQYAGYAGNNTFGWYRWEDGGGDPTNNWGGDGGANDQIVYYPIFDASATTPSDGDEWWSTMTGGTVPWPEPTQWGFYIDTNWDGSAYEDTFHSEDSENSYRHLEVFWDQGWSGTNDGQLQAYVLAWEDLPNASWSGDHTDFEGMTDGHLYNYGGDPPANPDYNDMIVRFQRYDGDAGDDPPREAPEAGTWLLLLATGAFGGWIKRRRNPA